MKKLAVLLLVSTFLSISLPFIAQADPSPVPSAISAGGDIPAMAQAVQAADIIPTDKFIGQVVAAFSDFRTGAIPVGFKISLTVLLLLALLKVSFLQPLWDKLGGLKAWAAPILGLLLGLSVYAASGPVTLAGILAYLAAGAGASGLHEVLDAVKSIPGLGAGYVSIINAIESVLGGGDK